MTGEQGSVEGRKLSSVPGLAAASEANSMNSVLRVCSLLCFSCVCSSWLQAAGLTAHVSVGGGQVSPMTPILYKGDRNDCTLQSNYHVLGDLHTLSPLILETTLQG